MIDIALIQPGDLTTADIRWIALSCLRSFDGATGDQIIYAAYDGQVGIHRISGDAEGIVILEPQIMNKKPGLKIIGLAGKDMLRNFCQVHEAICLTAKACGGTFVSGFVGRGALAALYKKHTVAKQVAVVFVENLS